MTTGDTCGSRLLWLRDHPNEILADNEIVAVQDIQPNEGDTTMADLLGSMLDDDPLASARFRYSVRVPVTSAAAGPEETRPFGLRFSQSMPTPVTKVVSYCHDQQVAVDADGRPLIETMGKDWKTKSATDGDEGPEENWGWEEE
ncbi:putative ATP-grasp-modified RiPP [Amycolatopsis sp. BJA-103]|uniref:putative ATP-grasp-modified RiPP n=1 Tax=Amycolatopsis sp. BJA-103 TaxID=1911175 RepID=UPI001E6105DA|nr:putative ATP-grasp-modified RiPP [Amycolatopsis sp. BJA-103]